MRRHDEDARSRRRLRDSKDICELAVRQPVVVDDALGVHLRQNGVAPNREQRERAKEQQDPQQSFGAHCFLTSAQTRPGGASSTKQGSRCQRNKPFMAKIAAKRSKELRP